MRREQLGAEPPAVGTLPQIGYSPPVVEARYLRLGPGGDGQGGAASLASEVPVALVYNGRPHAVMMCTPGDLEDFAVGFTVTEGIAAARDISRTEVVRYGRGIELQVEIPAAAADDLAGRSRSLVGRTGCGLCGVESIADALRDPAPVRSALRVTADALFLAGESLGERQPFNAQTHAIHAAAWADAGGAVVLVREDVGRHNALDKLIGALLRKGFAPDEGFAVVTSRASYELVQKAAVANVPLLAAVSRATALAVQLAEESGITLVGLLRGRSANVYTHPDRIYDSGGVSGSR